MGTPVVSSFSNLSNKGSIDCTFTTTEPDTLMCFWVLTWNASATPRIVSSYSFGSLPAPTLRYQKGHKNWSLSESHSMTYYWVKVATPGTYFVAFNFSGSGAMSSVLYAVPFTNVDWTAGPFDPGTSPANPAVQERNSATGGAASIACTSAGLPNILSVAALVSYEAPTAANGYTEDENIGGIAGVKNILMHKLGNDVAQVSGSHRSTFFLHDLIVGASPAPPAAAARPLIFTMW
jgi:hypothetical protein